VAKTKANESALVNMIELISEYEGGKSRRSKASKSTPHYYWTGKRGEQHELSWFLFVNLKE